MNILGPQVPPVGLYIIGQNGVQLPALGRLVLRPHPPVKPIGQGRWPLVGLVSLQLDTKGDKFTKNAGGGRHRQKL